MTAVRNLPNMTARMDRIVRRQREANIAKDLKDARNMLRSPNFYDTEKLRWACSILETYGDGMDYLTADQMIQKLNRDERMAQRRHPEPTLEDLKRQGVSVALVWAFIAVAVVYGGLLAYFGLLAWVAL